MIYPMLLRKLLLLSSKGKSFTRHNSCVISHLNTHEQTELGISAVKSACKDRTY